MIAVVVHCGNQVDAFQEPCGLYRAHFNSLLWVHIGSQVALWHVSCDECGNVLKFREVVTILLWALL